VQTQYEQTTVQLEVSDQGIRLQVGNATVAIDQAGNLDLTPGPTGKVRIQGDVDIQGELNAQLSAALTQSITQSVLAKLGIAAGALA
jgi:K+/H+ antiporter YhaU regulatory subunit KhtT